MRLQADETIIVGRYKSKSGIFCCLAYNGKTGNPHRFIIGSDIPDRTIELIRLCYNLDHKYRVRK